LFFGFGSDRIFRFQPGHRFRYAAGWACLIATITTPEPSLKNRQKYLVHVQKMLELLGDSPDAAKARGCSIMQIETALAKASLTRVEQRDRISFHKWTASNSRPHS